MFESHFTHHFFRLWGVKEGAAGIQPNALLLGNSQNEFDEKIGDVAGVAGCRFFIIEFKRDRRGIAAEVKENNKPHRYHLYQHLRLDAHCRQLSFAGHYAAYPDESDYLAFEPYAHAVAPKTNTSNIVGKVILRGEPAHVLDFPRNPINFNEFYTGVTNLDETMSEQNPGFYLNGFGLPQSGFEEYIGCMYQHLKYGENASGDAIVGIFSPKTGEFSDFGGAIEDLIEKLYYAFQKLAKTSGSTPPPPGRRGP